VSDLSGPAADDAIADKASQAGGQANEVLNQIGDTIRRKPLAVDLTAAALGFTWARFRH
jgi:hypothetical protein